MLCFKPWDRHNENWHHKEIPETEKKECKKIWAKYENEVREDDEKPIWWEYFLNKMNFFEVMKNDKLLSKK